MIRLSHRFHMLAGASLLAAAACGGDSSGDDDVDMPDAMVTPTIDAGDPQACPTHPNVEDMGGGVCAISGGSAAPITDDLTLTAGKDWLLDGPVFIGNDTDETVLTIEPGVTVYGGDGSFLLIQRGSKIMADGTAQEPIVLTSAKNAGSRGASDWGGLVINGRAPINNGGTAGEADGEAGTGTYGGTMASDNSGVLRYVRIEFAGNKVDAENELNGIAFQGVGSGTTVEYIQTHMTSDDGIEFFGGTVNVKHVVITASDDDSMDWTGGWSGNAQFVVAEQLAASGPEAERGIEADNFELDHSATPFSSPTLSNVTFMGRSGNTAQGMEFRRGTRIKLYNAIVTGFGGPCIRLSDEQTAAHVADGTSEANYLVLDCGGGATGSTAAADLLDGQTVSTNDPMLTGWQPGAGSAALTMGQAPAGEFFDSVDYAGAFDGSTNWADGWTTDVEN